ncbi:MAG: kinase [Chlamydiales bacterium]|nr:kinase [Chlamydiales bacterium]
MIISRTPVRISFFGGGTDYPAYYLDHEGAVLGTTIDQYTYISVKNFESRFFEHNIRIAYSRTELVKAIEEIQHPSIREALRHHNTPDNLDIHIFSDLPARTGLGSSSSFTVGFVNALYAIEGKRRSKQSLAEEACYIEQKMIEENVGSQDQFHAAYGGLNLIRFKSDAIHVSPVCLSSERKKLLQDHLLIFFTGMTRHASEIVKEQIKKTEAGSNEAYLKRMHALVFEAEKCLIESQDLAQDFGKLLHEGWELKKQLSSQVSNPSIDEAYTRARAAGAYGGKLCGAGNGGFLLFVVPSEKQDSVRKALQLEEIKFNFEDEGSKIIYMKE